MKQLLTICTLIWFGVSGVQASQVHTGEEQDEFSDVQQYEEQSEFSGSQTSQAHTSETEYRPHYIGFGVDVNHIKRLDEDFWKVSFLSISASDTHSLGEQLITAFLKKKQAKETNIVIVESTIELCVLPVKLLQAKSVVQILTENNLKDTDLLQTKGKLADELLRQIASNKKYVLRLSYNTLGGVGDIFQAFFAEAFE